MKASKKRALEKAGYIIGDAFQFLEVSDEERALIEVKHRLMILVRTTRKRNQLTQVALAKRIMSSQSRIAKLERGSSDVSLDLVMRALFSMGVSVKEVARVIANA